LRRVLASEKPGATGADGLPLPPVSQMSYYFRFYLTRALEHTGLDDLYLDQLTPWYEMLRMGLSTWAEQPEPTRSDCHAWSASPNYDLLTVVAGIRPGAPGFARVHIEPHLGKLTHLEAAMPHAGGNIEVSYNLTEHGFTAGIKLPKGLTGEFVWQGGIYPLKEGEQAIAFTGLVGTGSGSVH